MSIMRWASDIEKVEIAADGTVTYAAREEDVNDERTLSEPRFDHPSRLGQRETAYEGEGGGGYVVYALASAPTIAVFAGMIKTYIRRNADRMVRIEWKRDRSQLEIHGSYSVDEIERLIRAHDELGDSADAP